MRQLRQWMRKQRGRHQEPATRRSGPLSLRKCQRGAGLPVHATQFLTASCTNARPTSSLSPRVVIAVVAAQQARRAKVRVASAEATRGFQIKIPATPPPASNRFQISCALQRETEPFVSRARLGRRGTQQEAASEVVFCFFFCVRLSNVASDKRSEMTQREIQNPQSY